MADVNHLKSIVLEPVVELEPGRFAVQQRATPTLSGEEAPGDWDRYWTACLADAGIVGLRPLRPGSWHVRTLHLTDIAVLERIIRGLLPMWGGTEALSGPHADPVLSGGCALVSEGNVVIEPMCCGDLGNVDDWREAAEYRGSEWQMLWIGHPWLSVRFDRRNLILSEPHESEAPVARHAVSPEVLAPAVEVAVAALEDFSHRVTAAVEPIVGGALAPRLGPQLTGLH